MPVSNPFDQVEEALGMSRPDPFNFDSSKTKKDGTKLVGELVDVREFTYEDRQIPEKIIRQRDGSYRSLALWPPQEDQEEHEFHLRRRWEAANPEVGDFVAIKVEFKESATSGYTYGDFTVSVVKPEATEAGEAPVDPGSHSGHVTAEGDIGF